MGSTSLFLLRLIKRHGWEYVPFVLFPFGAWWYLGNQASGALGDVALLTAISGVHFLARKDIEADFAM